MLTHLEALKPNRPKGQNEVEKRVLCIIEGSLELQYIVKIFQLMGYKKDCFELSEEFIRVAWGKKLAKNTNIVSKTKKGCTFEGGSHKNSKVPFPAITAFELYGRDISFFDSVIVFFDADKDINDEVQNYFEEKFLTLEIENVLLVSQPCFESTLIDFCSCGECREIISNIQNTIEECSKYKDGLSNLKCFEKFKTGKGIVSNLQMDNISNLRNPKLTQVNKLIQNLMSSQ